MNVLSTIRNKKFHGVLNSVLVFLMLFMMLPFTGISVKAETDNTTETQSPVADNVTAETLPVSENNTSEFNSEKVEAQNTESPEIPVTKEIPKQYYLVEPGKEARLDIPVSQASITIPAGTVDSSIVVEVGMIPNPGSTGTRILNLFEFNAWEADESILNSFTTNNTAETGITENVTLDTSNTTDNVTIDLPELTDNTTEINTEETDNVTVVMPSVGDNGTSGDPPDLTDNITIENPEITDNGTIEQPDLSDNVTTETPVTTENMTIETPATGDETAQSPETTANVSLEPVDETGNVTVEVSNVSDNDSTILSDVTDNITIETPEMIDTTTNETDNTTTDLPDVTDNITTDGAESTDNVTLDIPSTGDNISVQLPEITDNITIEILAVTDNVTFAIEDVGDNTTDVLSASSENITGDTTTVTLNYSQAQLKMAAKTDRKVSTFSKGLTVRIQHSPSDLNGINPASVKLYNLNKDKNQWQLVPDSNFDRSTGILTATISHFSTYGEQADPLQVGPGRVMASEVNLHSGTATYSYPIELPPGPAGFKPDLSLVYNSGSVDGMKNKQDVGSWVGIGWSLQFGKITTDNLTGNCFLDLNGASYELIAENATRYHTSPEEYFQIVRNTDNQTWELWDKEGIYYKFGGESANATQYQSTTTGDNHRWDLSQIEDTNGNTANITYTQSIITKNGTTWVRSAYPLTLTYGKTVVNFTSGWDENKTGSDDGYVRYDNPITNEDHDAPMFMEDRRLDTIEILFDDEVIRKYHFDYSTTNRTLSNDYDPAVYYAGTHSLHSITQIGSDNGSLPSILFSYNRLEISRNTNETQYLGNPGNPASIYWPYLSCVNSGYGGAVTFNYTKIPDDDTPDIWSRQAVTSKILDGNGWLGNYGTRIPITIDSSKIDEDVTHFPVLIHLSEHSGVNSDNVTAVFDEIGTNYKKIAVTDTSGVSQLYVEVESWNAANKEAWLWVSRAGWKIDSSENTTLYLYYDDSQPDNDDYVGEYDDIISENVWDKSYLFVSHMEDSPGDSGSISNSTGYSIDGDKKSAGCPLESAGKIAYAQYFDGSTAYIDLGDNPNIIDSGQGTVSTWAQSSSNHVILAGGCSNSNYRYLIFQNGSTSSDKGLWNEGNIGATGYDGNWHNIAWTYDDTTMRAYIDGIEATIAWLPEKEQYGWWFKDCDNVTPGLTDVSIGAVKKTTFENYFEGYLDEINVSNCARSTSWIKASYYSGDDNLLNFSQPEIETSYAQDQVEYAYQYTGNPDYSGTDWSQQFKGWNEVTVTDSEGNSVKHWYYTTFDSTGSDSEKLTGKEYKTQWFDQAGAILKEKVFDWSWAFTEKGPDMLSGWDNRIKLSVDSTKIGEDLDYFPILIHLSENSGLNGVDCSSIFDEIGSNSKKIAVTQADGTQLYVEVEDWDVAAKEAWLWVSRNNLTVSSSNTTELYIYYADNQSDNDAFIGNAGSLIAQNVWDQYYVAVYHLNGATGSEQDSKAGNDNAYVYGASRQQEGITGDAISFDGNDHIDCGSGIRPTSGLTIEGFLKSNYNTGSIVQRLVTQFGPVSTWSGWSLYQFDKAIGFQLQTNNLTESGVYNQISQTGVWYHFGAVYDGQYMRLLLNGLQQGIPVVKTGSISYYQVPNFWLGQIQPEINPSQNLYGTLDEIRISSIGRSSSWLRASYYSARDKLLYFDTPNAIHLDQVEEITYDASDNTSSNTTRTRYEYDAFGNVQTEYRDGNIDDSSDNVTVQTSYNYNLEKNILSLPSEQKVYSGTGNASDDLTGHSVYYYDYAESSEDQPTIGLVTRIDTYSDTIHCLTTNSTYDAYGNVLAQQDGNGNITRFVYDEDGIYTETKILPNGFEETYVYEPGTNYVANVTDINGQITSCTYDEFERLVGVIKPGDTAENATTAYRYDYWGTFGYQNITILTKIGDNDYLWQKDYFDGLGRVIQTQSSAESGKVSITGTVEFDNRGLVVKQYVSQLIDSSLVDGYYQLGNDHNWLDGWDYRKQITISGSGASAQNNYQIKLNVYKGTGADSTESNTVHLNNHSKSDFSDLRFTTDDGETLLNYWIESCIEDTNAIVWVEFDSIPASPGTVEFYIYYGNSEASSASNGANTFIQFEDFEWGSDEDSLSNDGGSMDWSITNGYCEIDTSQAYGGTRSGNWKQVEDTGGSAIAYFSQLAGTDYAIRFRFRKEDPARLGLYHGNGSESIYFESKVFEDIIYYDGTEHDTGCDVTNDTWELFELTDINHSIPKYNIWFNGDKITDDVDMYATSSGDDSILLIGHYAGDVWLDDIVIRKWAAAEPLLTGWGSEESEPEPLTPYTSTTFDALGRTIKQTNVDTTSVYHDYTVPWQETVVNARGFKKQYSYDAFGQLTAVEEFDAANATYAITSYFYDKLGNLVQVKDAENNTTNMTYNWLGQKLEMDDPDMGNWLYTYDANGNLEIQTDAIGNIISFSYDNLNRLMEKAYAVTGNTAPTGTVTYTYDEGTNGNGLRTGMEDASGNVTYTYDARGRLVSENRSLFGLSEPKETQYTYDSADRLVSVIYPNDETVNQTYDGRGAPYSLYSSDNGMLVDSMNYNHLGQVKQINLHNGITTNYQYWGIDNTASGTMSYGKVYSIEVGDLLSATHTWDANGNLEERYTEIELVGETETFGYDFLDRLTSASIPGVGTIAYGYDEIGNLIQRGTLVYNYSSGSQPHAVDSINGTDYYYDANGNMVFRGSANQSIVWDAENRPVAILEGYSVGSESMSHMSSTSAGNYTYISLNQPLQVSCTLNTVEISIDSNVTGLWIGTFYNTGVNTYKCRDSVYIGNISASNHTISGLSLNGQADDYIGCYYESGAGVAVDYSENSDDYVLYASGEYIDADDENTYTPSLQHRKLSLKASYYFDVTTFVYDGDGNRVRKTVGDGDEFDTLYINKYYEENVAGGANVTVSYYLGDRLIAQKNNDNLMYVHQDHLSGTSLMTDENGDPIGSVMKYYPFGDCRNSTTELPTDRLFTGQRYDDTGLYYYGARYYDPEISRFISPDTIIADPMNPQSFNRYSYCMNNPLKYSDPTGHIVKVDDYILIDTGKPGVYQQQHDNTMRQAWKLFKETSPDIAQMLEDSPQTIHIRSKELGGGKKGTTSGLDIFVDIGVVTDQDQGVNQATAVIAHELVHATVNLDNLISKNSIYEEVVAFQYGNTIARQVGAAEYFGDDVNSLPTNYSRNSNELSGKMRDTKEGVWANNVSYQKLDDLVPNEHTYNILTQYYVGYIHPSILAEYIRYFGQW